MNVPKTELEMKLSALVDDQLEAAEHDAVLAKVKCDRDLAKTWHHYNLIRASVRKQANVLPDAEFAARISKAIEAEPTVVAPRTPRRVIQNRWDRLLTVTMAAGLMGIAVLAVNQTERLQNSNIVMAEQRGVASQPLSGNTAHLDARLNDYLANHNEVTYMMGTPGPFTYARMVSSNTDGR